MKVLIIISALFFTKNCMSQCHQNILFDSTIRFKKLIHERDTIFFKATLHSIGKVSQKRVLQKLTSKGIINKKNYQTGISFTPEGSNTYLYLPYKGTDSVISQKLFFNQNKNKIICIRGIIIRGFETANHKPFFLVNKIRFEE